METNKIETDILSQLGMTPEEYVILRDNYNRLSFLELESIIGKSTPWIKKRLEVFGWKHDPNKVKAFKQKAKKIGEKYSYKKVILSNKLDELYLLQKYRNNPETSQNISEKDLLKLEKNIALLNKQIERLEYEIESYGDEKIKMISHIIESSINFC